MNQVLGAVQLMVWHAMVDGTVLCGVRAGATYSSDEQTELILAYVTHRTLCTGGKQYSTVHRYIRKNIGGSLIWRSLKCMRLANFNLAISSTH